MGNFVIPLHQYIINNDAQAQLLSSVAGSTPADYTALDLAPVADNRFSVFGELDWTDCINLQVIDVNAPERIFIELASDPVLEVSDNTISGDIGTSTPALPGAVFRVVTAMPSLEDTAYQNIPLEKRYQIATKCETLEELAQAMVDAINADPNALVTATSSLAVITLTDKSIGAKSSLYPDSNMVEGTGAPITATRVVTTPGTEGVNHYENLKNIQWANCKDFDRDAQYFPELNAKYTSFYFEIANTVVAEGGHATPSKVSDIAKTDYIFYVKEGLALETAMLALAADMNV